MPKSTRRRSEGKKIMKMTTLKLRLKGHRGTRRERRAEQTARVYSETGSYDSQSWIMRWPVGTGNVSAKSGT